MEIDYIQDLYNIVYIIAVGNRDKYYKNMGMRIHMSVLIQSILLIVSPFAEFHSLNLNPVERISL